MYQTQFKGIKQTTLAKFLNTSDKQSYLWFVKDGDKRQIYLGETLYGELSDEKLSVEDYLDGLVLTDDKVIKLVDKDGNSFGEGVSVGDIIKGNIIHKVSFDEETKILSITFNTADGEDENIEVDFSDLVDTPDKIFIDKEITGLEEDKSLNDVLSDIYSKFGVIAEEGADKAEQIESIVTDITDIKDEIGKLQETLAENSFSLEEPTLESIEQGHITIKKNDNNELYGVMYYLSDIISGTLTAEDIKDFINADQNTVDIYDASFTAAQSNRLNIAKKEDVTLYDVDVDANNITNSGVINIKDTKTISLDKVNLNKGENYKVYNGVEIGLNTKDEPVAIVPNKIDIKNCDFDGEYTNNIINIFGTDDNTVVNIKDCHFGKCSNLIRLSNRTNASGVVINITDCTVDEWDTTSEYAGLFICQDYTSADPETANLFGDGKITFNIKNLTLNGVAVNEDYEGQLGYVYAKNAIVANQLGDNKMPVVNFV